MSVAIYTLTSPLHDESAVAGVTREFLSTLDCTYDFCGPDYAGFGSSHDLDLIYVRTGGTEGLFKELLPKLGGGPFYLLTSGKSNSLAASMEILSFGNFRIVRIGPLSATGSSTTFTREPS